MMGEKTIYLYGMVMNTKSYLIDGALPQEDGYAMIKEKYDGIGGETGTAAVVLGSLGAKVKIDGTHLGRYNAPIIKNTLERFNVDTSRLTLNETYDGVEDTVIISSGGRTCFGQWDEVFAPGSKLWNECLEEDILAADIVGLDPFFGDKAPYLCQKHHKKFATIDSLYDSIYNEACEVIAISHQYLKSCYPNDSIEDLYRHYVAHTKGLVIFTFGEGKIMYGRRGEAPKYCDTYKVPVISTLGAGDTFKAGTIYGLSKGMSDDELVRFAAATAAVACSKFPIPLNPPTLEEVRALIESDYKND